MIGQGSHWVAYRNVDKQAEYFDFFGLIMPKKVETYLNTSNKQIIYSGDEIQDSLIVLCGYWCLYYFFERQNGKSILETIQNAKFDMNDQWVNNRFIINYFNNI